ncbi:MAG: hypothetical protein A3K06_03165 [Candidatus Doudnabacteria bacterium RIFCSPHIGHO2_01_52_17]|uniref:N-acetyltransferase domain-containing protein n=1 Tax=Candidatus Doudnabacteria bacterium RIFCSPHIGHO2_01_52_17 TaxID=1817820 RepID=A0A1F5NCF6_9BACT|nr:MAG: hypothetical protein A3K06_03165 [Candidatus Doudnabacteria bacterium RIFCSPHIGHO2_01_52_17]
MYNVVQCSTFNSLNQRHKTEEQGGTRMSERLIIGQKCILGPMREKYLPLHVSYLNDSEVSRFLRITKPVTIEHQRCWLRKVFSGGYRGVIFAVLAGESGRALSQSGKFVGVTGLRDVNWAEGTAYSGLVIGNKLYWGRGIGKEARLLLLKHAFDELKLKQIYSRVAAPNLRIRGLLEATGYKMVSVRPRCRLIEGRYYDEVLYHASRETWGTVWTAYLESQAP